MIHCHWIQENIRKKNHLDQIEKGKGQLPKKIIFVILFLIVAVDAVVWRVKLRAVFILVLVTTLFWFRRKVCEGSNPVCRFLPLRAKLADLWSPVSLHLIFTKPTFLLHIFPPPTLLRHPSITTNPSPLVPSMETTSLLWRPHPL